MRYDADVVVVGAGPAGSTMAGLLARRGLRVLLLDKASFPREKPCGEGILPPGVAALDRMGLLDRMKPLSRPLRGLAYTGPGARARADFPGPHPGLGARRLRLDAELLGWAAAQGARFEEKVLVTEPLMSGDAVRGVLARRASGAAARWSAPVTLCAEGLHPLLRSRLGLKARWPRLRRFALVGRLDRVEGLEDRVEVFLGRGLEGYLTPTADGVSAAILYDESALPRGLDAGREALFLGELGKLEGLRERMAASRLAGPVLGWGPLGPRVDRAYGEGFLLLGDSAGSPDPIAGEGLALALDAAERGHARVAQAAESGGSEAALGRYEALRRELADGAFRLSARLVALCRRPWLRDRVVRNLSRRPELFEKLLEVSCGARPYGALTVRDRLRLVF